MKISECNYCGMLAITDEQDICASCQAFIAPETEALAQNSGQPETNAPAEINPFQHASHEAGAPMPAYQTTPNTQYVPQTDFSNAPPNFQEPGGFPNSHEPPLESSCLKCGAPIPRGQRTCDTNCLGKKSSPLKYLVALLLIGAIGFFTFDYAYEQVSPYGTFRKYAKTTGADDSLVFENFVLKGETVVSVDAPLDLQIIGTSKSRDVREEFSFKMVYKKPNVSGVELLRGSETVFKQVFDGTSGWKYTNMPGQPAGYQDTEDGFGAKKMGLGLDEYSSLEFLNEETTKEFGANYIKSLSEIKEVEVADIKQPSKAKTFIVAKQKRNGKPESTLLVFDQESGLLLSMVKNTMMGSILVTSAIYFDKYSKFPFKRKGLLGTGETRVLMPTVMKIVTHGNNSAQAGGMPIVKIELNVKTVETDAAIDSLYFTK
jgi:hypothetical protein